MQQQQAQRAPQLAVVRRQLAEEFAEQARKLPIAVDEAPLPADVAVRVDQRRATVAAGIGGGTEMFTHGCQ